MIECKHVSKIYKSIPGKREEKTVETQALLDVSFKIKTGEFVAIMGPSGSGKSTLMHILGCLDTPTNGEYYLEDQNISDLDDDTLADIRVKKIGFVFQSFNLLARATVLRNVTLPLIYAGAPEGERASLVKKALEEAAFPEGFWEHRSNQLSGGMMQRVAIARALVNNPSMILADEPTGNLDTKTGEVVLSTFQNLHDKGRTIMLITHEEYVGEHAERIIHIRDGRIIDDRPVKNRRLVPGNKHSL